MPDEYNRTIETDMDRELVDIFIDSITNGRIEKSFVGMEDDFYTLGLDSLGHVQFTVDVEKRYGIAIPDETAEGFKCINDVRTYLKEVL